MKRQSWFSLVAVLVIASMALGACSPATPTAAPAQPTEAAAQPTAAPAQPTAAPAAPATEAPTAAPVSTFKPMVLTAPDCNYGTADNPAKLKSIEAVDEFTVKFTLCAPDPDFASKVAFSVFSITSADALNKDGGDSVKMSDHPDGTGPYMLKEWVRGDHITMVANPNYWGTPAKAKTLIFKWSAESAQRLLELQSGTVDGIDNPGPDDIKTVQGDSNLKLYPRAATNIFYVGFQSTMKPFDNESVRQAFAMALDRKTIVDNFYPTGSTVSEQFVPAVIKPGFSDGLKWYDFDVKAAKDLLTKGGFPNGFTTTLSYRNVVRPYLPNVKQVAQEIQAELAKIGVTVKLKEMESGAFIDATTAKGSEPFFLLGWNMDYPGATNFYDYHFANVQNKEFGPPMPDIAAEIQAAAKLSDPAARQAHYDKANELIKQHVPMIPVANGGSATAFKAGVTGAHSSPLGNEIFGVMGPASGDQLVWDQNGEPAALWCSDEEDGETLRACEQMYDALLGFEVGGSKVVPALAEKYSANADATEWTFNLRHDVKFFSGKSLDANDVVATYVSQWDASNPNHKGRTGTFSYFGTFFGAFLNAKK